MADESGKVALPYFSVALSFGEVHHLKGRRTRRDRWGGERLRTSAQRSADLDDAQLLHHLIESLEDGLLVGEDLV